MYNVHDTKQTHDNTWPMAEKFVESGESPEPDLTEAIYPYAKNAFIILSLFRIVLLLISLKRQNVCRYYIYYELVIHIVDKCLPRGLTFEIANQKMAMFALVNFGTYYFEWWPSLLT